MGVNTNISRKPEKFASETTEAETKDTGLYHDHGSRRDIGQNTEKLQKHRKRKALKSFVEPDDHAIDIGRADGRVREIGVNTKKLPKTNNPPISRSYMHFNDKLRDIGSNTEKPHQPIDDGTHVDIMHPIRSQMKKLNTLIVKPQPELDPYEIPPRGDGRTYYEGCEYHFPGRGKWRRLFYNKIHGKYALRRPWHWLFTLLYAVLYILFVLIFSMAWFDYVTDDWDRTKPISKMAQPFVSFSPVGPRTNPRTISFDPRNNSDVSEKYAGIMTLMEKYDYDGDSGQNTRFGSCTPGNMFGYASGQPCVFLKVNRIIGFKTDPYVHADEVVKKANLGSDEYLALKDLLDDNRTLEVDRQNRTWITCSTGQHKDVQIEFHPEPGIRTEYTDIDEKSIVQLPVKAEKKTLLGTNDLNRIVALEMQNLKANERVQVNCKLWAHNILHKEEGYGQVTFYVVLAADPRLERLKNVFRYHDDSL